jgi:hypothetical protein
MYERAHGRGTVRRTSVIATDGRGRRGGVECCCFRKSCSVKTSEKLCLRAHSCLSTRRRKTLTQEYFCAHSTRTAVVLLSAVGVTTYSLYWFDRVMNSVLPPWMPFGTCSSIQSHWT